MQHENRIAVAVHVTADVLAPELARRKASGWLLDNVGNLLHAEQPQLVLSDTLYWQFQVALTSPSTGKIGYIGAVKMDAMTGAMISPETTVKSLHHYAELLARRAAPRAT